MGLTFEVFTAVGTTLGLIVSVNISNNLVAANGNAVSVWWFIGNILSKTFLVDGLYCCPIVVLC